ncbi:hypothetical protein OAP72_02970 [Flavobacteriaceae bacterium]|nr:hypothetical protein [Flavobacteriaceae bacterium]MDC0858291.1 hypothetical protein [Flavobacteriaceae bacterium]
MLKKIIAIVSVTLLFIQCKEEINPFLISNDSVGALTRGMTIKEIDSIFAQDSIVKLYAQNEELPTQGEVEVYEKSGTKLVSISPVTNNDPDALISNFQFFDPRYKTDKGLNLSSTFKDIKANYKILNIETTISTVVIFLEDNDLFINIDKNELPENFRYNPNLVIDVTNIPDEAKIKYFMLSWKIDEFRKK